MNLPLFIARRYLMRQKGTFSSFIIKLAIAATGLSVAVMILAVAFITGFKYTIRQKMFSFVGHVHVDLYNDNPYKLMMMEPLRWDESLAQKIRALPHVIHVAPYGIRPVIIHSKTEMEGLQLKGVGRHFKFLKGITFTGNPIDYSDTAYSKQILLSQTMANILNVNTGDTVELYFLDEGETFPRIRKVKIAGLFHTGTEEVDKGFAVCDLRLLQHINRWQPDQVNGYQVDLDNERYMDVVSDEIYARFIQPLEAKTQLATYTTAQIYPNVFDWLNMQDVNAQIILTIMAVVAIINLAAALTILIVEKARMVGLLKALGMLPAAMRNIFLYYSALIAGAGIIAGNVFALGVCLLQVKTGFLKLAEDTYYMKYVPVRFYWWQIALIDAATLLLCVLCMWLPTLYIRRIRPARVLQFK